jgi:adenosylhomocysteine nucleosidase
MSINLAAPLLVLAALRLEVSGVDRALDGARREAVKGLTVTLGSLGGRPVVVATSGAGGQRAAEAARFLCRRYRPAALISTGLAGGLDPSLAAGHAVVSQRVKRALVTGRERPLLASDAELRCEEALVQAARETLRSLGLPHVVSDCATGERLLASAQEKRQAWNYLNAGVVDLESYWACREAASLGVPFLVVRVVLDPCDTSLPMDNVLAPHGFTPVGALRYLMRRPWQTAAAVGLALHLLRARRRLTRLLIALATHCPAPVHVGGAAPPDLQGSMTVS